MWTYFPLSFCSKRKTGCLCFSIHVHFLKIKEKPNLFPVWGMHLSFESQCILFELPLQAVLARRPWAGLYRQQSSADATGRFPLYCKITRTWSAAVQQRKKDCHLLFKWNEVRQMVEEGPGLAAENLLLSTSVVSVSPWRNRKFKGNQRSWRISLAYFKWATEAEMGGS